MTHTFKPGDLVENGTAGATVIDLVSDDFLTVIYDGDEEPTIELATYFRHVEQD